MPPVLARERRIKRFGIECVSEILFSGWKPDGKIYTQKLTLKNVGKSMQTLTYMLPQVPNFFTPFPDPIPLPVGMEYSIAVSFKPTSTTELETYLEIHSSLAQEKFCIKLRAELPKLSCSIEQFIDFTADPTAVAEKSSITTPLLNDGEIPFLFNFMYLLPFTVSPMTGMILPNEQCPVTFFFNPKEAGSFSGDITLTIKKMSPDQLAKDELLSYTIKLNGLAQYSYMRVSIPDQAGTVCCFKNTPLFSTVSKLVYLENDSNVPFSFSVHPSWEELAGKKEGTDANDTDVDGGAVTTATANTLVEYSVKPHTGLLEAHGRIALKVEYTPLYCNSFYNTLENYNVEYITVKALSGVTTQFSIEASALPVPLELSENKVNLGVITFGSVASHTIQLKNTSKYPCPFEFSSPFMRAYSTPPSFVDPINGKVTSSRAVLSESSEFLSTALLVPDTTDVGMQNQILPKKRLLRDLPCHVTPSSGTVPAGIAISLQINVDLRGYTSQVSTIGSKEGDGKGFVAPYPLGGYISLRLPGGSPLFLLVTASILPEKGIDIRPPPITLNYIESWLALRSHHNMDELLSPLTPKMGEAQPRFELSPLFNDAELPEFAIDEAMKQLKGITQPITQMIADFRPDSSLMEFTAALATPGSSPYALEPATSLSYELFGAPFNSMKGGLGVKVSRQFIDFGYMDKDTKDISTLAESPESYFYIYNDSADVNLIVSWACSTVRGGFKLRFNGISAHPEYSPSMAYMIPEIDEKDAVAEFIASRGPIAPTIISEDDGVFLPAVLTHGLVCKIPPRSYGHYSVVFTPGQSDTFYHTEFTAICAHIPLLQYRSMRHCVVGSPTHIPISVTGCTRMPSKPTLSSGMPEISQPVVTMDSKHYLMVPPSAPGRVTRTSFALTNNTESHMVFSCAPRMEEVDEQTGAYGVESDSASSFLVVSPKVFVVPPNGGTKIVTVAIFFPNDAIENKTKYGFANADRSRLGASSTVLFSSLVRFRMNGSEETNITINLRALCSAPKLVLTTASGLNERLLLNYGVEHTEAELHSTMAGIGERLLNRELMQQMMLPDINVNASDEQRHMHTGKAGPQPVEMRFNPVSIGSEVLHTCSLKNASAIPLEIHIDTSLYANEARQCQLLQPTPQVTILQPHSIISLQFKIFADQTLFDIGQYQWPFNVFAYVPLNVLPCFDIITTLNRAQFYYSKLKTLCYSFESAKNVESVQDDATMFTRVSTDLWHDVLNHYMQTPLLHIVRNIVSYGLHSHQFFKHGYACTSYVSAAIMQPSDDTDHGLVYRAMLGDTLVTGVVRALVHMTPRSVTLDPPIINLGPFMPETSHDFHFVLRNNSNCAISFVIEIHEIMPNFPFLPELDSSKTTLKRYLFEQANDGTECYVPSLLNRLVKGESVLNDVQVQRCPTFFIRTGSCGVLYSNSQATITIVAVPRRAGFIKGRLVIKIVELAGLVLSEEHILDELRSECIYVQGLAKQILGTPLKETDTLLVSNIEVKASYPKFFIADASCPKVPSSQLRDILDVDSINDFLLGDVTPAERIYRKSLLMREKLTHTVLSGNKEQPNSRTGLSNRDKSRQGTESRLDSSVSSSVTTAADEGKKIETMANLESVELVKSFPVVLGPGNTQSGNPNYRVVLSVANPYDLPVEISFTLPHEEPNLEACPWARSLPPKHEQRAMDLLSRGIFILAPERIYLKKNEKRALTITYVHQEEGVHELQVQVSINNGRVFIFHLIGQTLGRDEPAVLAPIEHRFLPVALGEIVTPRQVIKLTNPGKVGVNYAFLRPEMFTYSADGELILMDRDDDSPDASNLALRRLRCFSVEQHDSTHEDAQQELAVYQDVRDILTCINPRGYLAPNSCTNIVFGFSPKSVGFYHFKVGLVIYPVKKQNSAFKPLSQTSKMKLDSSAVGGVRSISEQADNSNNPNSISPINMKSVASANLTYVHDCPSPRNDISMHTTELEAYYDINILDIPAGELVGYGEFDDDGLIDGAKPVAANKLVEVRRSNTSSRTESRCTTASSIGNSGVRTVKDSLPSSALARSGGSSNERAESREKADSRIYQVIDLAGYGFLPCTHIPQEIIPTYALGADADAPGCGSVTIKSQDSEPSLLANTQTGTGLCTLSYGRLIFGALPCLGYTSTIITIKGSAIGSVSQHPYLSQFTSAHYEWSVIMPPPNPNIRISVHPQGGILAPGETQSILINIYTGSIPMVTIEDIGFSVTFVTDKAALVRANTFNLDSLSVNNRLSATLANTQASAARIIEQAHHKGFNPQEITRAGIDIESRKHRAIFHGICLKGEDEDTVSTPLSRYSTHPHDDVLWLTLMCHTHRAADLECYSHAAWGLKLSRIACELNEFGTVNLNTKEINDKYTELSQAEADELDKIIKVTLRGVVNRLCTEETPKQRLSDAAARTKRRVINGMKRANFMSEGVDNAVTLLDSEDVEPSVSCAPFLQALSRVIFTCSADDAKSGGSIAEDSTGLSQ